MAEYETFSAPPYGEFNRFSDYSLRNSFDRKSYRVNSFYGNNLDSRYALRIPRVEYGTIN